MCSSTSEPDLARAAWEREYAEVRAYTTSYRDEVDRGVEFLLGYLRAVAMDLPVPVLECACGRGRNALPLARMGYPVLGLDHAMEALTQFRRRSREQGLDRQALPLQHDLRQPLPIPDAAIGTVLDITAVDNLVAPGAARRYGLEVARVLRPGGLAVVVTFDRDDGYYAPFRSGPPGPTAECVEDPHTGIHNRLFRTAELDAVFCPPLVRVAGNRFDFIDAAGGERWTRRFHLRLYEKAE